MKKLLILAIVLAPFFGYSQEVKPSDSIIKTKEIQEVLLKSQKKKQFSDHANYTFDKEALEKARHSKDF